MMKRLVKIYWKENVLLMVIMTLGAMGMVFSNFMRAELLNALVDFNQMRFIQASIGLFASYMVFLFFTYFSFVQRNKLIQKKLTHLREEIVDGLSKMDYQDYKKNSTGAYVAYLTTDLKQIEQQTLAPFYEVIEGLVGAVLAGVSLFYFHWSLILLIVVEVVLLIQLPKLFSKKIDAASQELTASNEQYVSTASEFLAAYDTFFSFRSFDFLKRHMRKSSTTLADSNENYGQAMATVAVGSGFGNIVSQVSVFVLTGYLVLIRAIGVGSLAATMGLAASIFNVVGNISQHLAMINSTQSIFDKFEKLREKEANVKGDSLPAMDHTTGLQVQQVSFGYDETFILNDFSYSFEPGKKYALVGESGSGKSTLFNLLTGRLRDYSGEILLNNSELAAYDYNQLYEQIAYVNQDPDFIHLSVRDNLSLGETFADEELWESLERAHLANFVASLPDGLETILSEKGANWSGGQLQRLAIARALLREKPILFLDEPTSKLDAAAAEEVEKVLLNLDDVMVIMITHHIRETSTAAYDDIVSLT